MSFIKVFAKSLKGSLEDAYGETRGEMLLKGIFDTISVIETLRSDLRAFALSGYVEKINKLINVIPNMTEKGCIDLGRDLQAEARRIYDTNIAESCSLWLAGAWIESKARNSNSALEAHSFLERLARKITDPSQKDTSKRLERIVNDTCVDIGANGYSLEEPKSIQNHSENTGGANLISDQGVRVMAYPDVSKCVAVNIHEFKNHTATLTRNVPNKAGIKAPFEYLYVMSLFSANESDPIFYVTAESSLNQVFLCSFRSGGVRNNYGCDNNWSDITVFEDEAIKLIRSEILDLYRASAGSLPQGLP